MFWIWLSKKLFGTKLNWTKKIETYQKVDDGEKKKIRLNWLNFSMYYTCVSSFISFFFSIFSFLACKTNFCIGNNQQRFWTWANFFVRSKTNDEFLWRFYFVAKSYFWWLYSFSHYNKKKIQKHFFAFESWNHFFAYSTFKQKNNN